MADAARVMRKQLMLLSKPKRLVCQWRITKHLRQRALRTVSSHKYGLKSKKMPLEVERYLITGDPNERVFSFSANRMNMVLAEACETAGMHYLQPPPFRHKSDDR